MSTKTCPICLEEGASYPGGGGEFVELKCPSKHSFHRACVEPWMKNNSNCPYCRQNLEQKLPNDDELCRIAEEKCGFSLDYLSDHLKTPDFFVFAITHPEILSVLRSEKMILPGKYAAQL
ncbi:MAG: RING finger domain-containing protein [Patescibacteria group bacterium]